MPTKPAKYEPRTELIDTQTYKAHVTLARDGTRFNFQTIASLSPLSERPLPRKKLALSLQVSSLERCVEILRSSAKILRCGEVRTLKDSILKLEFDIYWMGSFKLLLRVKTSHGPQ